VKACKNSRFYVQRCNASKNLNYSNTHANSPSFVFSILFYILLSVLSTSPHPCWRRSPKCVTTSTQNAQSSFKHGTCHVVSRGSPGLLTANLTALNTGHISPIYLSPLFPQIRYLFLTRVRSFRDTRFTSYSYGNIALYIKNFRKCSIKPNKKQMTTAREESPNAF
jgi:hypothetical protein